MIWLQKKPQPSVGWGWNLGIGAIALWKCQPRSQPVKLLATAQTTETSTPIASKGYLITRCVAGGVDFNYIQSGTIGERFTDLTDSALFQPWASCLLCSLPIYLLEDGMDGATHSWEICLHAGNNPRWLRQHLEELKHRIWLGRKQARFYG